MTTTMLLSLPVLLIGAALALGLRSNSASAAAAIVSQAVATLLVLTKVVPVLRGSGPLKITGPWPSPIDRMAFIIDASGAFFLTWSLPLILLGTICSVRSLRSYFERGRRGGQLFALLNMVCVSFLLTSVEKSLVLLLGVEIVASATWLLIIWNQQDQTIHITVIADNPEAIDDLQVYLRRLGVVVHSTRDLRDAGLLPPTADAVVLFPDEYDVDDATASITSLRAARPQMLILIVTSTPQHFRSTSAPAGPARPAIVLPQPTFGGTILDAIRAHAQSEAP